MFTLQAWDRYERLVPGVEGPVELSTTDRDDRGSEEDAYYPRIEKDDGGMAWAGPVWVGVERECYQGVLSFVGGARPRPSPSL